MKFHVFHGSGLFNAETQRFLGGDLWLVLRWEGRALLVRAAFHAATRARCPCHTARHLQLGDRYLDPQKTFVPFVPLCEKKLLPLADYVEAEVPHRIAVADVFDDLADPRDVVGNPAVRNVAAQQITEDAAEVFVARIA